MKTIKFNIGDLVSVINDTIKGKVVSIELNIVNVEDENGFIYPFKSNELILFKEDIFLNINIIAKEKTNNNKVRKSIKINNNSLLEVDLHIHQITDSNRFMSNTHMLQKQLSHARAKLNYAINNNIQKVVFIHGVGKGILKTELLKLFKNYPLKVEQASFKKYGQGATEVYIYKSKK